MNARHALLATLCLLGAVGTASAVAVATQPEPTLPSAPKDRATVLFEKLKADAAKGGTTAVSSVDDSVVRSFRLFREREASPVPAHLVHMIASPTRFGRNPVLARSIDTPYGTGWVIPGDGYLCLAVPGPIGNYGVTCSPTEVAVKEGLWGRHSGQDQNDEVLETLVVPDGNKVLELAPDGRVVTTLTPSAVGVVSEILSTNETTPAVTAVG
jgi:hypothetical protein